MRRRALLGFGLVPRRPGRLVVLAVTGGLSLLAAEAAIRAFGLFAEARSALAEVTPEQEAPSPAATGERPQPTLLLHPFRGWTQRPGTVAGLERYWGRVFPGSTPPAWTLERRRVGAFGATSRVADIRSLPPGAFVVAVFGGSVAEQLVLYGGDRLLESLARARPDLAGRLEILSMAGAAHKQPQQLQALIELVLHGVPVDLVVNLDGFNEVVQGGANARHGVHPYFPDWRRWTAMLELASGAPSAEAIVLEARILELRRASAALAARLERIPVLSASVLARSVAGTVVLRQQRCLEILEAELAAQAEATWRGRLAEHPDPCLAAADGCWALIADQWAQSSLLMAAVARSRGAAYAHLLQPNQYVPGSKPLTREEDLLAHWPGSRFAASVPPGYAALRARGPALAADGIAFRDLTDLFRERTETLYVDNCCHLNRQGYLAIAEEVAALAAPPLAER